MEIKSTTNQGESIVNENIHIAYNVVNEKNKLQNINGVIHKNSKMVGFVSYDNTRSGLQFSLHNEHGLSIAEQKATFETFVGDVEQLITD
jgi:hypothetical protein